MAGLLWVKGRQRCFRRQGQAICNLDSHSEVGLVLQPAAGRGVSAAQHGFSVEPCRVPLHEAVWCSGRLTAGLETNRSRFRLRCMAAASQPVLVSIVAKTSSREAENCLVWRGHLVLRVTNSLTPDWWQQAPCGFAPCVGNGSIAAACAASFPALALQHQCSQPRTWTTVCRRPMACCTMMPSNIFANLVSAPALLATAAGACPDAALLAPTALSVRAGTVLSPAHTPRRRVEPHASLADHPACGLLPSIRRPSPLLVSGKPSKVSHRLEEKGTKHMLF